MLGSKLGGIEFGPVAFGAKLTPFKEIGCSKAQLSPCFLLDETFHNLILEPWLLVGKYYYILKARLERR